MTTQTVATQNTHTLVYTNTFIYIFNLHIAIIHTYINQRWQKYTQFTQAQAEIRQIVRGEHRLLKQRQVKQSTIEHNRAQ